MKFVGKWKIRSSLTFDGDNGMVYKTPDELIAADPGDGDVMQMKMMLIEFTESGEVLTIMPIPEGTPEEAIEAAKASGMEIVDDAYAVLSRSSWKEEDGAVKYDTGVKGEVLGEAVDPWAALTEDEEGLLSYGTMKLERA